MADLSPQAQAVLDAFAADNYGVWLEGDPSARPPPPEAKFCNYRRDILGIID